ncbi:MAG: DUF1214 domain-containing protein, partial [Rhodobacterales bacterium]|nr:DUF1214 domain-containing protein [Rhodobacterales bacterium]
QGPSPTFNHISPFNNVTEPGTEKSTNLFWVNTEHGYTDIELRAWMFTDYYSMSPGMVSQTPDQGAAYWIVFNDADGAPLTGDTSYKLTLPPDVPAKLFWSMTLYEAENASGLATEARRFPSLGSRDEPELNEDGTTDVYIGPEAPEGEEVNWLPTAPDRGFFGILRLYGPGQAAIDYSWKPSDLHKVN